MGRIPAVPWFTGYVVDAAINDIHSSVLDSATPIKPSIPDPNNQTAAGTGTTAGEAVVVVVGYAVGIL